MLYSYSAPVSSRKQFIIPCRRLQVSYFSSGEYIQEITDLFLKYRSASLHEDQYTDIDSFLLERGGFYVITESLDESCRYKVQYSCTCPSYMHYKACSHVIAYGLLSKKMDPHPNVTAFVKSVKKKPCRPKRGNCYSLD